MTGPFPEIIAIAAALALIGHGDPTEPEPIPQASPALAHSIPAGPDITRCNALHKPSDDDPAPTSPVKIPKAFRHIAVSSALELALLTQSGATFCERHVGVFAVSNMAWLRGDRFLGWEWEAYEAFGYGVFDRAGAGTVIETGIKPVFSPGGKRFASVEFSDFGALGGFAVWEVGANETVRIGGETSRSEGEGTALVIIEPEAFLIRSGDWTMTGWKGETCVHFAFDGVELRPEGTTVWGRQVFHAAEDARWQIAPGACP